MIRHIASLLLILLTVSSTSAQAQDQVDWDELERLTGEVERIENTIAATSSEDLLSLTSQAVPAYRELLGWYSGLFESETFSEFGDSDQAAARAIANRAEYNLARHLTALDQCDEARDRLRSLLDRVLDDSELRAVLTQAYDHAVACLSRERNATLRAQCSPEQAELLLDGAFLGLCSAEFPVPLGEHVVTIRADGFQSQTVDLTAQNEGEALTIGPINLEPVPGDAGGKSPRWSEWTLWGAGVAGIAMSVGYFVAASDRQSTIDDLPADEMLVDSAEEQSIIDRYELIAFISGGVGLVSAITGTVLYVLRDGQPVEEQPLSWGVGVNHAWVEWHF